MTESYYKHKSRGVYQIPAGDWYALCGCGFATQHASESATATAELKVHVRESTAPPSRASSREGVLDKAKKAVMVDRNTTYADPEDNFAHIAALWNAYLGSKESGETLDSKDVASLMILVKLARLTTSPQLEDHWTDIAGYAACGYGAALTLKGNEDATPQPYGAKWEPVMHKHRTEMCRNCAGWTRHEGVKKHCPECDDTGRVEVTEDE